MKLKKQVVEAVVVVCVASQVNVKLECIYFWKSAVYDEVNPYRALYRHLKCHLCFMAVFQLSLGYLVPNNLVFFLHFFRKKTFGGNCHRIFCGLDSLSATQQYQGIERKH